LGKWNRLRFKILTVGLDVYQALKELKRPGTDSFSDVIRRLLKKEQDNGWSFVRPVAKEVRDFWESDLFG